MQTFKLKSFDKLWSSVIAEKKERLSTNFENRITFKGNGWYLGGSTLTLEPTLVNQYIDENLKEIYGKELTLKIFIYTPYPLSMNLYNCHWGQESRLFESTSIQNILAFYGYAPHIADLVFLQDGNKKYVAQVTEFIPSEKVHDEDLEPEYKKEIESFCYQSNILMYDFSAGNVKEKKITDFQGFKFIRRDNVYGSFLAGFIEKIKTGLSFGGDTDIPYQSIEELGIVGRRNNLERDILNLSKEDFKGKSVLDVGCNGGYFLRRAMDNGATIAVGMDTPKVSEASYWLNNYLGYFNMSFTNTPDDKYDIVFFLSMMSYLTEEQRIKIFKSANLLFFEGHGTHTEDEYMPLLKPYFSKIDVLGYVNDYPESGQRVILRCEK